MGFTTGCLAGMDRRLSPHRENWAARVSPRAVNRRWRNSGPIHSRRAAPRGRGVGRGFPSPRKTMVRSAERFAPSPRGESAPHAHKSPESPHVPFRKSCGVLFPRGVNSRWWNPNVFRPKRNDERRAATRFRRDGSLAEPPPGELGRVGFTTGCLAGMDRRLSPHRENWAARVSPQAVNRRWRNSGPIHSRRAAPRGRGVGRGFPSPRKTMVRSAERFAPSPRGESAPHAHKSPESPHVPFRKSCGVLFPRAVQGGASRKETPGGTGAPGLRVGQADAYPIGIRKAPRRSRHGGA